MPPDQRPPKPKGRKSDALNGSLNHLSGRSEADSPLLANGFGSLAMPGPFAGTPSNKHGTTTASHGTTVITTTATATTTIAAAASSSNALLLPQPAADSIVAPDCKSNDFSCDSDSDSPSSDNGSDSEGVAPCEPAEKPAKKQPKGLIDGLSKFFTPGNKRKTRVSETNQTAKRTLSEAFKRAARKKKIKVGKKSHHRHYHRHPHQHSSSKLSQQTADKLVKKSRMIHSGINSTNGSSSSTNSTKGSSRSSSSSLSTTSSDRKEQVAGNSGQVKGLFDGLSHLFTAQGEKRQRRPSGLEEYEVPRAEAAAGSSPRPISVPEKVATVSTPTLPAPQAVVACVSSSNPSSGRLHGIALMAPVTRSPSGEVRLVKHTAWSELSLPPPVWRRSGYASKHHHRSSGKRGHHRSKHRRRALGGGSGEGGGGRGRGSAKGKRLAMLCITLRPGACDWLVVSLLDTFYYYYHSIEASHTKSFSIR